MNDRPPFYSLIHLQKTFGDRLYSAAKSLADGGHVANVRVLQAGAVVTGIAGIEPPGHRVYIQCQGAAAEAVVFKGECNCGALDTCAHVLAVLMAALRPAQDSPVIQRSATVGATAQPLLSTPPAGVPARQRQHLRYVVDVAGADTRQGFLICAWVGQTNESGAGLDLKDVQPLTLRSASNGDWRRSLPRYIDDRDRTILDLLIAHRAEGPWTLCDEPGVDALRAIVDTGRAFWQSPRGAPLRLEELQPDRPAWRTKQVDSAGIAVRASPTPTARLVLSADLKATLEFVYAGENVDSRTLRFDALRGSGNTQCAIERDPDAERNFQVQFNRALGVAVSRVRPDAREWLAVMMDVVPALEADGWTIAVHPRFPYRIAAPQHWYADLETHTAPPTVTAAALSTGDREWFNLRLGVSIDGQCIDVLPALSGYLQGTLSEPGALPADDYVRVGDWLLLRIAEGRFVPVAMERIRRIADTLVELFDRRGLDNHHRVHLPKGQAGRVAQLAHALNHSAGDDDARQPSAPLHVRCNDAALLQLIDDLDGFTGIAALPAPVDFQAVLRPYQEEGLGWLQFLRQYRLGGILADDMGLGKTVQTVAHLALEQRHGRLRKPSLIVAPVSVIGNWQQELKRFTPQLRVLTLHGAKRKALFAEIGRADVVITGYPLLVLDRDRLLEQEFYLLILDEAQMIKNPRAQVSQVARELRAELRLGLTGTPLENHLGELWSLFDCLQPGLLGTEREFQRQFRTPIEKDGATTPAQALTRRIAPFLLRRTKDFVAKDLPPKTEIVETVVMDERQQDFYDGIRLTMHRRVRELVAQQGLARSHITVLDALLKLRQACCDPRLVSTDAAREAIPSAKLEWLTTVLPELIEEGRRVLLFSQFTSMLALIETAVEALRIPFLKLTGTTQNRGELVARFQAGEAPLFLISLKAGGTGLNLTAADTVIHYDPWWNPAVEAQATDRAHRIGQDKPLFVYKLITQGTVEEKIVRLQADKKMLADRLYTGQNASLSRLTAADLETLFAP